MDIHDTLILGHLLGGAVAFIAGCIILVPSLSYQARSAGLRVFLAGLAVLILSLWAVVIYDWPGLLLAQKITFGALSLLALYMAWRAVQAFRVFYGRASGGRQEFTDHIGFNLISLFDGFVIVSALDLGAPGWLVGLIAILGVVVGIWATNQVKTAINQRETDRE